MSGRAVARGVVMAVAAGLALGAAAQANEAAHKMAEKFAGSAQDADKKPTDAKQHDKDKDAERKAAQAKQRAAAQKAQAARSAAEARRKAAEAASRAAEERRADEADMLARARREADELRAADELERLTLEARSLVEEAEKERARAEALLASEAQDRRTAAADEERLARQRTEETRRLVEKLNRVRQIREARLAAQAQRRVEGPASAVAPPSAPVDVTPAEKTEPRVASGVPPPLPAPAAVGLPPSEVAPPPAGAATPPATPGPRVAAAEMDSKTAAEMPAAHTARAPARLSETQVTVLIILEPGSYGIRRRGPTVADPILCIPDGCYVSTGADQPAVFMPGRRALRFGNTLGARAGACRGSLGCVFRDVELGSLPGYLQPVDLHILRHDRREVHTVLTDSGCRAELGHLVCTHGVQAQDYTMWVLPESLAKTAGAAALERALADGLPGRRSAELMPR